MSPNTSSGDRDTAGTVRHFATPSNRETGNLNRPVTPVERKKAAEELDEGAAVPVINQFIDPELARLPAVADSMPESRGSLRELDAFLHDVRTEM